MNQGNRKITLWQYAVLMSFLGNGLFEGVGAVFLFNSAKQSAPVAALFSLVLGIIPIFLIYKIINYQPDKNIIDKINNLFNHKIANIINLVIAFIILFILTFNLWILVNFSSIKYLSKTPPIVLSILFLIPTIYTVYKGIEGIARSSEILLYIVIIFHIIITQSLSKVSEISNVLPLFQDGLIPVLKSSIILINYTVPPFILMSIIPKNNVIDNKKFNRYYYGSYLFSMITMVLVSFMVISTIGPNLATLYRFPLYYVMKKIEIIGVVENVENIFSTHWIFNMYITICMCIYYLHIYLKQKLNLKTKKSQVIILLALSFTPLVINQNFFNASAKGLHFLENFFPYVVTLPMMILILIIVFKIKTKFKTIK